jgi:hypothetical protein
VAIGAATPDRARVQRRVRTGERVRGAFKTTDKWSEPFRCRYTPANESESRSQSGVRRAKPATLLVKALSLRSSGVGVLKASDRVEITQADGTRLLMEVQGEPDPIRKRRTVIGYTASLQKVRDSEAPNV